MRLLNTKTLKLEEFYTDIPPYAILSHTWEKEEVTFQDVQNLKVAKQKAGYAKIQNACVHARKYDFEWIWIDSCCINKESSAELSEAINSMYQYYEDAKVCYVYLCDVSAEYHPRNPKSRFRDSRWFKRGWTLQELLAPLYVVFLDKDWERIGTRWSLRDVVSAITSIPEQVFEGCDIEQYSVAQRMSWAAYRETTRPEDQAYCLMGIFGVSMPPIYGEGGARAFMRLQQEIIKVSDDRSIFAWVTSESSQDNERGLLARSPYEYRKSGQVLASDLHLVGQESSYSFSNNGLHIHLPLEPVRSRLGGSGSPLEFVAFLHCQSARDGSCIAIHLRKKNDQQYVRCHADKFVLRPSLPDTPHNMHELTARETPIPRNVKRLSGIKSTCHVELMPSAQHFVCVAQLTQRLAPTSIIDENTVSMTLLEGSRWTCPPLIYECPTSRDAFSVQLKHSAGSILPYLILQGGETLPRVFNPHMDSIVGPMIWIVSGDYVSVTFEQRGSLGPLFKIDCISQGHPEVNFMTQTLRPPESGFMVLLPSENLRWHPQLEEIFPPDSFAKRTRDMAYITTTHSLDVNIDATSHDVPFRVLKYRNEPVLYSSTQRDCSKEFTFYIVLGIHKSVAWLDVVFEDGYDQWISTEELWKTYLDFGSRERLKGQSSVSTKVWHAKNLKLTASIEQSRDSLLESHLVPLKLESFQDSPSEDELDSDVEV